MANTKRFFRYGFSDYACIGDRIFYKDGKWEFTARLEPDDDNSPPDERSDGFWPSLDPKSSGYIGSKTKHTLKHHMRRAELVMQEWLAGRMFYVGVVLDVSFIDVQIVKNATSLWGVECNWPGLRNRNAYLRQVADDLLPEARAAGELMLADIMHAYRGSKK